MTHDTPSDARIAEALGSAKTVEIPGLPSQGPLDLLLIAKRVELLRGFGDVASDVDCHLRLSPARWRDLEIMAGELSAAGRDVSPQRLAQVLLEQGVDALKATRRQTG